MNLRRDGSSHATDADRTSRSDPFFSPTMNVVFATGVLKQYLLARSRGAPPDELMRLKKLADEASREATGDKSPT